MSRYFEFICERAFLFDPARTYSDLVSMGKTEFANQLKHDHLIGRLQDNVAIVRGLPASYVDKRT